MIPLLAFRNPLLMRVSAWCATITVVVSVSSITLAQESQRPTTSVPTTYGTANRATDSDLGAHAVVILDEMGAVGCDTAAPVCEACASKRPVANPCASAFKPLFYDNDFSYLESANYQGYCLGDCWKHLPVDDCGQYGTMDIGGQLRLRYHHEIGMGQDRSGPGVQRFEDTTHDILLSRVRLYSNWHVSDTTRLYVEGIFADVTDDSDSYLPRPIDRNFGDFLNAFIDYSPREGMTFRVGRQELLYGAERLVSPLDWSNTRRSFEGMKLMIVEGDWRIDGFYTHYVPVVPNRLDHADYQQPFYGAYSTYSGWENRTLDLYYLGYDYRYAGAPITSDFSLSTLGSRLNGTRGNWLYELEGGVQLGRQSGLGLDQDAGYGTAGLGRKFPRHPWTPTVWFYYDYASGHFPDGDFNRFNHLFPLGHKYLGFIDAVQRSNIEAPNVLVTMKPGKNWDLLIWYWHFQANSATDIVPAIGGTPIQSVSETHMGDELDLLAKYQIGARSNVLFGYSHFWRGSKILAPQDADFFYAHWELNF